MSMVRCPVCGKRFESAESTSMPFCSDRCRRIDLGRWLGESYSVPVERQDEDDASYEGDRLNNDGMTNDE
ncbi:MAG: DNA gyrase inhibitor YacG [Pirellulales bacterium]